MGLAKKFIIHIYSGCQPGILSFPFLSSLPCSWMYQDVDKNEGLSSLPCSWMCQEVDKNEGFINSPFHCKLKWNQILKTGKGMAWTTSKDDFAIIFKPKEVHSRWILSCQGKILNGRIKAAYIWSNRMVWSIMDT